MLLGAKVLAGAFVALLVFLLSPVPGHAFCGSLCSPQAALFASTMAKGGTATGVAASTVATAEVGVAASSTAGTIAGLSLSGVAAATGLTVLAGGLPDWLWSPSEETVTTAGTSSGGGGFSSFSPTDWTSYAGLPVPSTSSFTPHAFEEGQTTNITFTQVVPPASPQRYFHMMVQCANNPGVWSSGYSISQPSSSGGFTTDRTILASKCSDQGGFLQTLKLSFGEYGTEHIFGYAPGTPTDLTGNIETTVTCNKNDGTSYILNSSTPLEGVSATSDVAIAGLSCDPGDFASDGSAVLSSPTTSNIPLISPPSFDPWWQNMPDESKTQVLEPDTEHNITYNSTTENTYITYNTTTTSPGETTEAGTSFCGMNFADVLSGEIMFKAVGCAMSWAFVPSDTVVESAQLQVSDAMNGTGLATWTADVAGVSTGLADFSSSAVSGSCTGPQFNIALGGNDYPFAPLDACDAPMSTVAVVVKVLLSIMLILAGINFVVRPVLASFGLGGGVS